jgi:glycosyltransferase involved in cell wall biosynthesis
VQVVVVHPRDIAEPTSGGIQTFLRDFIGHSPSDFSIVVAGVTNDVAKRPIGRWQNVRVGVRDASFLPLGASASSLLRPGTGWATLKAAVALRRVLTRGTPILQLHRPYRRELFTGHRGPRVRFIHVDLESVRAGSGWRRLAWLYRGFSDDLADFDRVYVANERGSAALQRRYPALADRIEFLSGWYDSSTFKPPAMDEIQSLRGALRDRFGLPEEASGDRWVIFAGRLEVVKDPLLALRAFALVSAAGREDVRLMVCGGGELGDSMRTLAQELGVGQRVHLLGDQPREILAQVMAAGDVLVVSSQAEGGGPRVVLEALGSGLPVVTTMVGEVMRSVAAGRNGWLAAKRTPEELAAGLIWALAQSRAALSLAATTAAAPFVAERVLARAYDAYRLLVDDHEKLAR